MAHLEDLKSVIVESLDRKGVLNSIQGKIRAEVFSALDDRTTVKPKPSNDTILINELIREYLNYNNYKYAAMTLAAESAQAEVPLSRDFIEAELGVRTSQQTKKIPLLYSLVHSFVIQHKRADERMAHATGELASITHHDHFVEEDDSSGDSDDRVV